MRDIRSDWPTVSIDKLCVAIVDCVNRTAPVVDGPTPYRMIRTTNVRDGFIDISDNRFVEEETFKKWTRRQLPLPGDVILTREAPLGEVGIVRPGPNIFLGQRLVSYRADPSVLDARYLLYYLRSGPGRAQVSALGSGATVAHMRVPDAKNLKVPLPTLREQCRIGEILGAYDDLIEVNRRRVALLEEMARGLFEQLVARPAYGLPAPGMSTADAVAPPGWSARNLVDVATIVMGQSPPSALLNREQHGFSFHQGVSDFSALFPRRRVFCSPTLNSKLAQPGDVLFSVRAPVGRINVATEPVVLGRGVCAIRSLTGHPRYLLAHMRAAFYETDLIGNGSIYKAVNRRDMERIPILLAPAAFQDEVERRLAPIYDLLLALDQSDQKLAASRDLLLPRLISGQLSVAEAKRELALAA